MGRGKTPSQCQLPRPKKDKTSGLIKELLGTNPQIIRVFPKIGVSQNGWLVMENTIKMDDLGVPLYLETLIPKSIVNLQLCISLSFVHVLIPGLTLRMLRREAWCPRRGFAAACGRHGWCVASWTTGSGKKKNMGGCSGSRTRAGDFGGVIGWL